MKKYLLPGGSKDDRKEQVTAETKGSVSVYEGYRFYVFSQSLHFSQEYRYDFSKFSFNVGFLILQGENYRDLQFIYTGYSDLKQ